MDRQPVEDFKLSEEQMSWMKQFKRQRRIADYLTKLLDRGKQALEGPREALRRVLASMEVMGENAPSSEVRDLYGQPKPMEEENERSVYDVGNQR